MFELWQIVYTLVGVISLVMGWFFGAWVGLGVFLAGMSIFELLDHVKKRGKRKVERKKII